MRRPLILAAVIAFVLAGGVAYATIPDSSGVIHGCYGKYGGVLHVVDSPGAGCRKNETALDWNVQGQAGAPVPLGRRVWQGR